MLPRVAFLAALCSVLVSPTVARAQDLASIIVGVWKAISVETKEVVSGKINRPFGDKPEGTWVFTRGGRTSLMLFHGDRKSPAAANATDAERVALFNSMTAYIGTYQSMATSSSSPSTTRRSSRGMAHSDRPRSP